MAEYWKGAPVAQAMTERLAVRADQLKGLGIVPYTLPGSQLLADRTIELLDEYDVVMWTKHGALAVGTNVDAISGATVSTKGVTTGVNAALAVAGAIG